MYIIINYQMWKVIIISFASLLSVSCQIVDTFQAPSDTFQIPTIPDSMYIKVADYHATVDHLNNIEVERSHGNFENQTMMLSSSLNYLREEKEEFDTSKIVNGNYYVERRIEIHNGNLNEVIEFNNKYFDRTSSKYEYRTDCKYK
jgi:hypothetical protein